MKQRTSSLRMPQIPPNTHIRKYQPQTLKNTIWKKCGKTRLSSGPIKHAATSKKYFAIHFSTKNKLWFHRTTQKVYYLGKPSENQSLFFKWITCQNQNNSTRQLPMRIENSKHQSYSMAVPSPWGTKNKYDQPPAQKRLATPSINRQYSSLSQLQRYFNNQVLSSLPQHFNITKNTIETVPNNSYQLPRQTHVSTRHLTRHLNSLLHLLDNELY